MRVVEPGTAFATAFDRVAEPVAPPGVISSGLDPRLRLVDGFRRREDHAGTCTRTAALLGFVVPPLESIRVELDIIRRRANRRPSLIEVRSPSASTLCLVPSGGGARVSVAVTTAIDVPGEDIPERGLLLLEILDGASRLPEKVQRRLATSGARGLAVLEVRFAAPYRSSPRDAPVAATTARGLVFLPPGSASTVTVEGRLRHRPRRSPDVVSSPAGTGKPASDKVLRRPEPRGFFAAQDGPVPKRRKKRKRRWLGALLRIAARVLPTEAQPWLVAASLRGPGRGSLRRVVAFDAVSGRPVDVTASPVGANLVLAVVRDEAQPVIVALPVTGRWSVFGCGARWMQWQLRD